MARWLILAALGLAGCGNSGPVSPPPAPSIKAKVPMELSFESHALPMGQLTVINVPVGRLRHATEHQVCFLWREPGASSLQCPNDRSAYKIDPPR